MTRPVQHIATVIARYDSPEGAKDGDYSIELINFSGTLDLNRPGQTDIDLINEAVSEWLPDNVPKEPARFIELILRRVIESTSEQYYEVAAANVFQE